MKPPRDPLAPPKQPPRDYAIFMLGRRDYSAKELRDRMKRRGYTLDQIEPTLTQLAESGLQSDARYAEVQTRMRAARSGNRKLRQQLKQNGVAEDLVDAAMEEAGDETERAVQALRKFHDQALDAKLQQKIYRFLASRGFGFDAIKKAVERRWGRSGDWLDEASGADE